MRASPEAFRFGRNWQRYIAEHLDPDRERIAAESLDHLVGDLTGKSFLDVGCGSGLFSLCAYRAGASDVLSFDVDPDSVAVTEELRLAAGAPENWRVLQRSILDPRIRDELPAADVVYSWGVLHHTGDMYAAIRNAAQLVKPGGKFAIAIYNRVSGRWLDSERWLGIKRAYNRLPYVGQKAMELVYAIYWALAQIRSRRNLFRTLREYRQSRGMALSTNITDWLGGYPYEFAPAEEIVDFCERSCGMRLVNVWPVSERDTGNNEFLFERIQGAVADEGARSRA